MISAQSNESCAIPNKSHFGRPTQVWPRFIRIGILKVNYNAGIEVPREELNGCIHGGSSLLQSIKNSRGFKWASYVFRPKPSWRARLVLRCRTLKMAYGVSNSIVRDSLQLRAAFLDHHHCLPSIECESSSNDNLHFALGPAEFQ